MLRHDGQATDVVSLASPLAHHASGASLPILGDAPDGGESSVRGRHPSRGSLPPESDIARAGHEVRVNPPRILAKTRKKFGAKRAEAQRKAIVLSKARRGDV